MFRLETPRHAFQFVLMQVDHLLIRDTSCFENVLNVRTQANMLNCRKNGTILFRLIENTHVVQTTC